MIADFGRNNLTLCSIPLQPKLGARLGKIPQHALSNHHWELVDKSLPGFDLVIRWSFDLDSGKNEREDGGCYRAYKRNGWVTGTNIQIYQFGKLVNKQTRKWVLANIRARICASFGYDTEEDKKITRYRFQYIATFPSAVLEEFDCHHKRATNAEAIKQAKGFGTKLRHQWTKATDDRICNLKKKDPKKHRLGHLLTDDQCFKSYIKKTYHNSMRTEKCGVVQLGENIAFSHFGGNSEAPIVRRYLRRHRPQSEPSKPT